MMNEEVPGRKGSYDTRRSSSSSNKKVYEEMLLKELPGSKRSNQPMHAVLESSLDDTQFGIKEAQKVRNHALIHYLASLANSNNNEDTFDFDFVESLIVNGADINSTDKSGQTIFHEVARSWNLDVASFLIEHGANINQQDKFGRSPLHVAAAVDYADMLQFLVKNGADINIATEGEGQMPIHYAAKNDACKSLKMLLGYGADINSRDSKDRTPLQVAAEMNRAKSSKLLVQHGAPAGVHDNVGNSALSLLIEKLPDVAVEALDQFHSVSTINRKEFFFLNYLEGNHLQDPKSPAYSSLEIAVQNQEFDVILHPVMQRLTFVKWQKFGRQGAIFDLVLNLVYTILWTILAVSSPVNGKDLYRPWSEKAWRLVLFAIVCLMTMDEIRKQLTGTMKTRNRQKKWISWRAAELEKDLQYCHPRWPQEEMYLKSEIKAIRDTPLISTGDSWIYFDWFCLFLILGTIASNVVFFKIDSKITQVVYARIITVLLLVLWFRIMKYARPFEGTGPFVVVFGHIIRDIINWGFLFVIIFIPYACAFWITFGRESQQPVESYSDISPLLYNLFSMVVVSDHDYELLVKADRTMAGLLCGSFIGVMAIINLNILIALLSDTFTRVYGNAVANAVMQRAKTILFLEKSFSSKKEREYRDFIRHNGSPETVDLHRDITTKSDRDEQKTSEMLKDSVGEIHTLVNERFGKQYGEGRKSDLDIIKESLADLQETKLQELTDMKKIRRRMHEIQGILTKLSNFLDIDIGNVSHSLSEDDCFPLPSQNGEETHSGHDMPNSDNRYDEEDSYILNVNSGKYHPDDLVSSRSKGIVNEGYQRDDQQESHLQLGRGTRGSSRELREEQDGTRGSRARGEPRGEVHQERLQKSRREGHQKDPEAYHISTNPKRDVHPDLKRSQQMLRAANGRANPNGQDFSEVSGNSRRPSNQTFKHLFKAESKQRPIRPRSGMTLVSSQRHRKGPQRPFEHRAPQYSWDKERRYERWNSGEDDETSQSDLEEPLFRPRERPRSYEDDVKNICSDNDIFRKRRSRSSKVERYYDNWDSRSTKSVTF